MPIFKFKLPRMQVPWIAKTLEATLPYPHQIRAASLPFKCRTGRKLHLVIVAYSLRCYSGSHTTYNLWPRLPHSTENSICWASPDVPAAGAPAAGGHCRPRPPLSESPPEGALHPQPGARWFPPAHAITATGLISDGLTKLSRSQQAALLIFAHKLHYFQWVHLFHTHL